MTIHIYTGTPRQVGKRLFSYVAVLKTPIGDVTANFSPYYGEVGMFNAGHAMFPPLVHKDVVKRKEALVNPQLYFFLTIF